MNDEIDVQISRKLSNTIQDMIKSSNIAPEIIIDSLTRVLSAHVTAYCRLEDTLEPLQATLDNIEILVATCNGNLYPTEKKK